MIKSLYISLTVLFLLQFSIAKYTTKLELHRSKSSNYVSFLGKSQNSDLGFPYFAKADIGDTSDNLVAISLFNSHIFISGCSDVFGYYNCTANPDTCIQFPKIPNTADYPYFSISGYRILVNMTLGRFGRGNRVKATYATNCTRNSYNSKNVVGSVGFSLNESNIDNFDTDNNRFSIWLEPDGSDGEFIFGEDSDRISGGEEVLRITNLTKNWEFRVDSLSLLDTVYDMKGVGIIDINSYFLGVPDSLYNQLLSTLKHRFSFVCQKKVLNPNCTFSGDIANLPPLIINSGGSAISLPSNLYTRNIESNLYKLLFVSLTENPQDPNQILITKTYKNYLVLGSPFLQYYYTVFNYTNQQNPEIGLYVPTPNRSSTGLSAWAIIGIILGALLLVGVIAGSIWAFRKNREKKKQESLVNPEARVGYVSYNQ